MQNRAQEQDYVSNAGTRWLTLCRFTECIAPDILPEDSHIVAYQLEEICLRDRAEESTWTVFCAVKRNREVGPMELRFSVRDGSVSCSPVPTDLGRFPPTISKHFIYGIRQDREKSTEEVPLKSALRV